MSIREKSAWISLVTYLGVYSYYVWWLYGGMKAGDTNLLHYAGLLTSTIVLLVVTQIVLSVLAAISAPKDAKAPRDERDKLIHLKATRVAFVVVNVGTLAGVVAIAMGADPFYTANGLLLVMVAGEIARSIGQIVQYRWEA